MRSLRVTVLLATVSGLLLTGCTDPSPDVSPTASQDATDGSSVAEVATAASDEPEEQTTTASAPVEPEPPVFGTAPGRPSGIAVSACIADALGEPLTYSTVLTATDPVTIESLTIEPMPADAEIELLDAYVLPFDSGTGGVAVGDYPPADPYAAREDAAGYELGAEQSVRIGVGVTVLTAPTSMALTLTYHGADEVSRTLTSEDELTVAARCTAE